MSPVILNDPLKNSAPGYPENTAWHFGDGHFTYGEINQQSGSLANHITAMD